VVLALLRLLGAPGGLFAVLVGLLAGVGRMLAECWLPKIAENPWYYYVYMYVCICMLVCWLLFTFDFSLCIMVLHKGAFFKKTTNIANKPTKSPNPLQRRRFQCWLAASKRPTDRPTFAMAALCNGLQQPCPGSGGLAVGLGSLLGPHKNPWLTAFSLSDQREGGRVPDPFTAAIR